jgi:hypothetical protein
MLTHTTRVSVFLYLEHFAKGLAARSESEIVRNEQPFYAHILFAPDIVNRERIYMTRVIARFISICVT